VSKEGCQGLGGWKESNWPLPRIFQTLDGNEEPSTKHFLWSMDCYCSMLSVGQAEIVGGGGC
jgi:hypothetical protein